jgi:DUF971 family protein
MMPLFMRKIWQKDNYTFSIEWNDQVIQEFRLSHLQKNCPCANCRDEVTGKSLVVEHAIPHDLRAVSIRSVGRYGLRVRFASGCSTGIYSFDYLRGLKAVLSDFS